MQNLLGDANIRQDGDFSYIRTSNLYHYSVPKEFYGMRYKTLFKHLVLKRFMIPLGIYRTEKVSFAALDPSSKEEDDNENNNQLAEGKNSEDEGEADTGKNQDQEGIAEDFKAMADLKKKNAEKGGTRKDKSKESQKDDGEKYMKEIKYVITNPDKDLKLKENDTVFVLAQNDPKDPNVYWED